MIVDTWFWRHEKLFRLFYVITYDNPVQSRSTVTNTHKKKSNWLKRNT